MTEQSAAPQSDQSDAGSPGAGRAPPVSSPVRSTRVGWLVGIVTGIVLWALVISGVAAYRIVEYIRADVGRAGLGDCLDDAGSSDEVRRVDCDSPDAAWIVVRRVTDVAEHEFTDVGRREELCGSASTWKFAFWAGDPRDDGTGTGSLLCLEPRS